jgi:small subunit ribosomal protein S8
LLVKLPDVRKTLYVPTFRRISKPGQRIYVWAKDIKKSRNWKWIFILSTPKWVMTWYEARALNVGGELICEVF